MIRREVDMLDVACKFRREGWYPVPIPYRTKGPTIREWQKLRLDTREELAKHFNGTAMNIGVILGACSGHTVDVDLDQPECLHFAKWILPTTRVFGRPSNLNSHWLYRSETDATRITFDVMLPGPDGPRQHMFLELRANGHQTVFPPSIHESGEPIRWRDQLPLASIDFEELKKFAGRIAAGAALAQAWPREKGCRHRCELALAGILLRSGFSVDDTEQFIRAIATIANTENAVQRAKNVTVTTDERLKQHKPVTGWRTLSQLLNQPELIAKVPEWLGYSGHAAEAQNEADEENSEENFDDEQPKPAASLKNAVRAILERDLISIRYDEFLRRPMTADREWNDADDLELCIQLQGMRGFAKIGIETVRNAALTIAYRNRSNCVKAWLDSLVWDREPRIDHFFEDHFSAEGSAYIRAASKNFWISMVARVYRPGCQADHMIVLEGSQGIGKSSALRIVGGDWFCEQHESVTNHKAFGENLQGFILVEISEMDSFTRSEVTKVKAIITSTNDQFRNAYAHHSEKHPRQCIFAGTTNRNDWNKDETGARRFWPIACREIDLKAICTHREQFFAESVHRFKAGELWHDMPVEETRAEQESRYHEDVWLEKIKEFVDIRAKVTVFEIMDECLKFDTAKMTKPDQMRVATCLRRLGWSKGGNTRVGDKVTKVWSPEQ